MRFDLHIHSEYSPDSNSSVKDIISRALKAGLQGISITDHNSMAGSEEAMKTSLSDILVIPGAEYSTDMGHMLVYFLRQGLEKQNLLKNTAGRYKWRDIIGAAHEQGALVFLAHPFKSAAAKHEPALWDGLDGLEVYNSRTALCRNMGANKRACGEASRLGKAFSAGSDAHWLGEIGKAFWEYDGKAEIKEALKSGKGRVWGSPSSRFYEPASQLLKGIQGKNPAQLPRPLVKMAYAFIMEAGRMSGLGRRPYEGWLDLNDKPDINDKKEE